MTDKNKEDQIKKYNLRPIGVVSGKMKVLRRIPPEELPLELRRLGRYVYELQVVE